MATRLTPNQSLLQLSVSVPTAWEEAGGAILEDLFGQSPASFSIPDGEQSELSVFIETRQRPSRGELARLRARLRQLREFGLPDADPAIRLRTLRHREWQDSWKRHFKPFEVGRHLLLRPSWSRRRARRGQAVVVLDPGLSFGTGQHPTTRFCLRELVRARPAAATASLLDVGTGSGILAIAAAKLGYAPVHALDVDPNAVRVARRNASRNRVTNRVKFRRANLADEPVSSRTTWDVVCANLLADLLIQEAEKIFNRVKKGGTIVLAGILTQEFAAVDRAYQRRGACRLCVQTVGEWRSASYRHPG